MLLLRKIGKGNHDMNETDKRSQELIQGEELFAQGFLVEAKQCFLKLASGPNPCKEALNNLGVIAYQEGDGDEAIRYFTESLLIDPCYEDARENYLEIMKTVRKAGTREIEDVQEQPDREAIPGRQASHRHETVPITGERGRARIAILCTPNLETFLGDIVMFLQQRFEVRTCYSNDFAVLESAVRWADLVWLEWANQIAEILTKREGVLDGKRVICRVHSYEVLEGYLSKINWGKITKTIFVASHVLEIAHRIYPQMMDMTSAIVISNGVDLDKYSFKKRTSGFNLAVVGHINNKKNPSLWTEIMHRLVQIDDRYRLKVAGALQEVRYGLYFEHAIKRLGLEKNIQFSGQVENVAKWLESENINYLLSTSIFESFGYGIAEAMAMGYRPLINDFPGAAELWPSDCLFSSIDDLIRLLRNDRAYKSLKYRRFVAERYDLQNQLAKIEELINSLIKGDCTIKYVSNGARELFKTQSYWENRYQSGWTSGSGSYGRLADYKAEIINNFITENNIESVLDLGCGDGNQLSLLKLPQYVGMDISSRAVSQCQELFKKDLHKTFFLYEPLKHDPEDPRYKADMAISLDVIYHLVENDLYELYMQHLFGAAQRYVVIYSSNEEIITPSAHEKRRKFNTWVEEKRPDFKLIRHIINKYPYDPLDAENTSLSDFYIFGRSPNAD